MLFSRLLWIPAAVVSDWISLVAYEYAPFIRSCHRCYEIDWKSRVIAVADEYVVLDKPAATSVCFSYLPLSHLLVLVTLWALNFLDHTWRNMECASARFDIYFVEHIVHVFNLILFEFPMNMILILEYFHH